MAAEDVLMPVDEQTLVQHLLSERTKLIAYIWSIVHDAHIAEDVFQEVSLVALRKRQEIGGVSQVFPWLRSVARHKALKALSARSRRPMVLDDDLLGELEEVWNRHDAAPASDTADALEGCVRKLSPRARRIIELRYGAGLSGGDVATVVGVQVKSIYQALSRIHVALADCVRQTLFGDGRRVREP